MVDEIKMKNWSLGQTGGAAGLETCKKPLLTILKKNDTKYRCATDLFDTDRELRQHLMFVDWAPNPPLGGGACSRGSSTVCLGFGSCNVLKI